MQAAAAAYEASSSAILVSFGDYYRQHGGCAVAGGEHGGSPLRILATSDALAASAKSFALGIAVTEVAALAATARRLMHLRHDGAHLYA